ncbi:hypothetical protein AB6A40_000771 [Gnathostoma spinigerum]|uniref:Transmembrane protein 208 n=1 Tax=Gnathostoma spinigerum TaxID=75299 RepID=A0ABD6EC38_9BILA
MEGAKIGKAATRGQKQIHEENMSTIRYYSIAALCSCLLYISLSTTLFECSTIEWIAFGLCAMLQFMAVMVMRSMAKCVYNDKHQVVDAGMDLNQEGAFGEYCKDIVILCSFITVVATFWSGILWLLLVIPAYVVYKVWTCILGPWFFAQPPEDDEEDSSRRKRREKKLRKT